MLSKVALGLALMYGASVHSFAYQPGKFYHQGNTKEKVIALTFDDGPGRTTVALLELLRRHNIKATFFMEGSQIETYPEIAKQVVAEGHEVGNHTYVHFDYHQAKNAAPQRLIHELAQTEAALKRAAGIQTDIVRMPHGYFNRTWLLPTLKEKGYALVHWSYGNDWILFKKEQGVRRPVTAKEMAEGYIKNARPGAVFLFHDGGRNRQRTLDAVTEVIQTLQPQGFRFVPAKEMF